ncbi:hypothetical protein LTS10_002685 [Elasticomyces elasticus]|nr:hypothetical protein LTS10_002685 [Elasticomyces elasticus]
MGLRRRNVKQVTVIQTNNGDHASDNDRNTTPAFFRLPPELRNLIYELALPRNENYTSVRLYTLKDLDHWLPSATTRSTPPLLATCTLIRAEGLPIFYGSNKFWLALGRYTRDERDRVYDTLHWLKSIDLRGLASMKRFGVLGPFSDPSDFGAWAFTSRQDRTWEWTRVLSKVVGSDQGRSRGGLGRRVRATAKQWGGDVGKGGTGRAYCHDKGCSWEASIALVGLRGS